MNEQELTPAEQEFREMFAPLMNHLVEIQEDDDAGGVVVLNQKEDS